MREVTVEERVNVISARMSALEGRVGDLEEQHKQTIKDIIRHSIHITDLRLILEKLEKKIEVDGSHLSNKHGCDTAKTRECVAVKSDKK